MDYRFLIYMSGRLTALEQVLDILSTAPDIETAARKVKSILPKDYAKKNGTMERIEEETRAHQSTAGEDLQIYQPPSQNLSLGWDPFGSETLFRAPLGRVLPKI